MSSDDTFVWPEGDDLPPVDLTMPTFSWQDDPVEPVAGPERLGTAEGRRGAPTDWDWDFAVMRGRPPR